MDKSVYLEGRVDAVKTTGVFCRPGCPGRPKPENVEQFASGAEALLAGYRACKRCHPLGAPIDGPEPLREGFNQVFQQYAGAAPAWRDGAETVHVARIETPLGVMIAAATRQHLVMLEFGDRRMRRTQFKRIRKAFGCNFTSERSKVVARLEVQLKEFFDGTRRRFDIPMRTPGTSFQSMVWRELQRIPAGATRSYAQVAKAVGRASAVRAVARANGDNRIAILIPCHRVIGSDGSLTGYGGGLPRKQRLLELESAAV